MSNFNNESALALARQVMEQSYSPYSGFQVGAVVITAQGQAFSACNVENAAYPEGTCAEAGAIAAMVSAGFRLIKDIYIIGQSTRVSRDSAPSRVTPCGGCRQRIREFADQQTRIHLCSIDGTLQTLTIDELLPHSFGPEHLPGHESVKKDP